MSKIYFFSRKKLSVVTLIVLGAILISFENIYWESDLSFFPIAISVDPEDVAEDFSVDQVVESVRYVPLQTTGDFLIGTIRKISIRNEHILIVDRGKPAVFLFDITGKAKSVIGRKGGGPGEFEFPGDAIINPFTNTIDVYSSGFRHKIMQFSYDGKFLRETLLDYSISGFEAVNAETYALYRYEPGDPKQDIDYNMVIISRKDGRIINKELPYQFPFHSENQSVFLPRNIFNRSANGLSIRFWNSDQTYLINSLGTKISTQYSFDFGNGMFLKEKMLGSVQDLEEVYQKGVTCCINPIIEMPKHIFFSYRYQNYSGVQAIYDKSSGNLLQYKAKHYHNSFNKLQFLLPECHYENELVFFAYAHDILNEVQNPSGDIEQVEMDKLKKLSKNLNEMDNPILIFYELKDF